MSKSCSNACKLSPMGDSISNIEAISNVEAIRIYVVDSVGVRYVNACCNDLLSVMLVTDAAPICVSDLPPVLYFEDQMRV